MSLPDGLKIFSGRANESFTERLCEHIGMPVGKARVAILIAPLDSSVENVPVGSTGLNLASLFEGPGVARFQ